MYVAGFNTAYRRNDSITDTQMHVYCNPADADGAAISLLHVDTFESGDDIETRQDLTIEETMLLIEFLSKAVRTVVTER